jgi:DNA mismatch repair ATPase MutS
MEKIRELLTMLSNQQQEEITEKLDKVWRVLDEFFFLKEVLEMMDQQLNDTPFTFDSREERIQLLLNTYREKFQIHFDDSRKILLEIEKILIAKPPEDSANG